MLTARLILLKFQHESWYHYQTAVQLKNVLYGWSLLREKSASDLRLWVGFKVWSLNICVDVLWAINKYSFLFGEYRNNSLR